MTRTVRGLARPCTGPGAADSGPYWSKNFLRIALALKPHLKISARKGPLQSLGSMCD